MSIRDSLLVGYSHTIDGILFTHFFIDDVDTQYGYILSTHLLSIYFAVQVTLYCLFYSHAIVGFSIHTPLWAFYFCRDLSLFGSVRFLLSFLFDSPSILFYSILFYSILFYSIDETPVFSIHTLFSIPCYSHAIIYTPPWLCSVGYTGFIIDGVVI